MKVINVNNIKELIRENTSNKFNLFSKNNSQIKDDLKNISSQIAYNDMWFAMEDDSDLVEACIYQRESLQARYRYLLRKAKESKNFLSSF